MSTADPSPTPQEDASALIRLGTFRLARRLRAQRVSTLSDPQLTVLLTLHIRGGHTLGELADRERVSAPSMNRTVNALEEGGYVRRAADETDRRKVNITLTPSGQEIVEETLRRRDAWLDSALTELTPHEQAVLVEAAHIMRKVAER